MFFVIEHRLPSLNEYIDACRTNKFRAAQFKRDTEDLIVAYIRKCKLPKIEQFPVELFIEWHEKDRRRDVDNIKSSAKFILDALQKARIIPNDRRKYVSQIHDTVIDDEIDFVAVTIKSCEVSK